MPQISVIVPVYNVEKYFRRCVDSILAQTYTDFELILVDDGSPDFCGVICDEYAVQDKRVRVIHKENGGVSSARNAGLDVACGNYAAFVDSDDYIAKDYLAHLMISGYDLVITGSMTLNEKGERLYSSVFQKVQYKEKSQFDYPFLYKNLMLYSPCSKLFRLDIIKENQICFKDRITWGEDGMFVADYLPFINSIFINDCIDYHYIKYDLKQSLSSAVREDIVKMISTSREYCVDKVGEIAPERLEQTMEVCCEDIKRNCAYFVCELLRNSCIKTKAKAKMLQSFIDNQYVRETMKDPNRYYSQDPAVKVAMHYKNVAKIIVVYSVLNKFYCLKLWMYHAIYLKLPKSVQKKYQSIRNRVR